MPRPTAEAAVARIAEHVTAHRLPGIQVVLHGGEPLLAGTGFISWISDLLRAEVRVGVEVHISLVTNGTLLDEAAMRALRRHDVRVAVSLDGGPLNHDARRVHPGGRGSYDDVRRGLGLLGEDGYRHLFAGLLCVVDPGSDPVATYEHLLAYAPPVIDVLLPHGNWSDKPLRPGPSPTPYGDWLIALFDRWYTAPRREASIRLFDEIIRTAFGRPSRVESIGTSPATLVVVETDGALEQVDALKSSYAGAAATGLNVHDDPFDAALRHPMVIARQLGVDGLADACRRCDVRDNCGGGYFPHRYQRGSGFRNPSVYCSDLMVLIHHVLDRVRGDVGQSVRRG